MQLDENTVPVRSDAGKSDSVSVTYDAEPSTIGTKRFYPPFSVTANCPTCGKAGTRDGSDAIYYPELNQPFDLSMYCYTEGAGGAPDIEHEWSIRAVLRCSIDFPVGDSTD